MMKQSAPRKLRTATFVWAWIFLALGIAGIVLGYFHIEAIAFIYPYLPYIYLGCFGLSMAFLFISAIASAVLKKAIAKEEMQLVRDIHLRQNGERALISEKGTYFGVIRQELNNDVLMQKGEFAYGTYEEDDFDDAILSILESEVTYLAGLVYIELTSDHPIKSYAPVEALLTMAKSHFGEKAFYGKRDCGVAVFVPYLGSKEEMMGKLRKVVQLYSYSEEDNHINVKAGIAFYPDISPRNMTSSALKATISASPLENAEEEVEVPLVGYKAAETVSVLLAGKLLTEKLQRPLSRADASAAFREFALAVLPSLGAEVIDVLSFDAPSNGFRVEEEATRLEGSGFSKFVQDGVIPGEYLDAIYAWSIQEKGMVSAAKGVYLPEEIKSRLDNLEINSIAALAIQAFGEKLGLLIVGSNEHEIELTYSLQRYFAFAERYLHVLVSGKRRDNNENREDAILGAFEHYAYAIASNSYNLSYISPNLSKSIPNAKIGMPCYAALFGKKKPCKDCPLFQHGVEKVMPMLSSGVFAFRALPKENETLMVLAPHDSEFSISRIDPLTGFSNDAALHEDLQGEILLKANQGQVLAFRIRNADSLRGGFRLSSTDEIIRVAAEALNSARLSRGLYRNGENGFAYLLPFASRKEAVDLAELVSKTLTVKLPFHEKQIELFLDFALVNYPVEANDTFALDSLLRVLYQKADASSRGRLFEVDNPAGRLVDHNYFARVKLEEALRAGVLPVDYRNYEELAGNKVVYRQAVLAMLDEDGQLIEEERVYEIADSIEKGIDTRVAMVRTIVKQLVEAGRDLPRGIILKIVPSCFSDEFLAKVDELFVREKLARKLLVFEVDEADIGDANYASFAEKCKKKGYCLGLGEYKADMDVKQLKGYSYVNFASDNVYGVHKDEFLLGLGSVRQLGLNVLVHGFASKQEKHYLASLSFHYGQMKQ